MLRNIPSVEGELLYHSEIDEEPIVVGTPAWYDWLEQHTSFLFVDHVGAFTARTLTLARLQAAAQALFAARAGMAATLLPVHESAVPAGPPSLTRGGFLGQIVTFVGTLASPSSCCARVPLQPGRRKRPLPTQPFPRPYGDEGASEATS